MAELATAYLVAGAEGDDKLERIRDLESGGIRLSRGIVEDVAYWRRLRQLVGAGVAPGRELRRVAGVRRFRRLSAARGAMDGAPSESACHVAQPDLARIHL